MISMYCRDNEANKNTGESSSSWGHRGAVTQLSPVSFPSSTLPVLPQRQILASSCRQTEFESDPKESKRKKSNREAVEQSKQKKITNLKNLEKEVEDLEETKASMISQISNLEDEINVLMNENKELKNQVDPVPYLKAVLKEKLTRNEQMTLEIQQQKVATSEQIQNPDQYCGFQFPDPNMYPYQPNNNQFYPQQASPGYLDQVYPLNMIPYQLNNNQFNLQQASPCYLDQYTCSL